MEMSSNADTMNNAPSGGFLSGFIEASVEKPSNGLNGDCTVHYSGQRSTYTMKVRLVNGVREGEAVIVNDGIPYLRLEYNQGSLTGVVERMNGSGVVDMRGHLLYGVESGFFEEYDSSNNVIWRGFYKNGVRDSGRGIQIVRKGKDSVRSIEKGEFYELDENGVVTQLCLYENGVRSRVLVRFSGEVMTELDENGKQVYEGGFKGDVDNGFVRDGFGKEYGTVEKKVKSISEPKIDIETKQFLFWVREIKHEVPETETVTTTCVEKVVAGYWKNGKKEGMVYDLDENGNAKRGCLFENDAMVRVVLIFTDLIMIEFDSTGRKVYEGVYYGDMKSGFFCHEPVDGMDSFFKEVDSSGQLIAVSQYDELNVYKNGKCYEMENGDVKRMCLYENGRMKRVVQEFNDATMIEFNDDGKREYEGEFRGDMKNGYIREGIGKEMDENESVVYEGEWRNGHWDGIGEMIGNGTSVLGHWEDGRRNGLFYERDENGVTLIQQGCLYENDEIKQMIQEYELYDMILSRRIDYRVMFFLDQFSLFVSNITTGHAIGTFQLNRKCFSVEWLKVTYQGFMVDKDTKEMTIFRSGKQIIVRPTTEVIDLDANGRRWEGSVRNGKPFGFGVLFNEEGRKEYEGFMIGEKRICYGVEYYSDLDRMRFEGCYFNNYPLGKGTLYDRNGAVEYDGLWKYDSPSFDGVMIDDRTKSIDVPNDSYNESNSFILHAFIHSLKRIVIGDDCFGSVRVFELDGLGELETVVIGKKSFRISDKEQMNGTCRIVKCPKLKSIQIDDESFHDYHSFELSNLLSLQSIEIGRDCFKYGMLFSLTGLIDWLV